MTPDEFRQAGYELIDWIADHRTNVASKPVLAQVEPGWVAGSFEPAAPEETVGIRELLTQLDDRVMPGVTQVQHPMHFGWFPSNASLSSVLGDLASSGIGGLGISWESCPALSEVEEVVCDWLRQLTGLSDRWLGTIQDTASTACLVALLSARERANDHAQVAGGMSEVGPLAVYTTSQAHSSVRKAALLAGYGANYLRIVNVDPNTYAMDAAHLAELVEADRAAGVQPAAVVATVGTTGTTAIDPLVPIGELAEANGLWLHVDAAMAGSALLLPECRSLFDGIEQADSICWNPHKWMGAILDTSLYYVRDSEHLVRVMSTNPSYLRSAVDGQVTQYRDWGIPLGRRFRSLKLLFQLRLDGVDSIKDRLRRDLDNARWLAEQVAQEPGWEVVAPVQLQTVCVRHLTPADSRRDLDSHTLAWVGALNRSGRAYLTSSLLDGSWMVRVSIGVEATTRVHVEELWRLMRKAVAAELAASSGMGDEDRR